REAVGMASVTLLERDGGTSTSPAAAWTVVAHSGPEAVTRPDEADVDVPVGRGLHLALRGRSLTAADHRVLNAFAAYAAVALEQQRLTAEAEAARPIAEADRMRTALLTAVSHDLRTPLASAKAAVTSLRSPDVTWDAADRGERLATAAESLHKRTRRGGRQPAGDEQAAGGGAVGVQPADRPRRSGGRRTRRPGPRQPGRDRGHPRVAARGRGGPRDPGMGDREPHRERTPLLAAPQASPAGRPRARRPGGIAGGGPGAGHPGRRP